MITQDVCLRIKMLYTEIGCITEAQEAQVAKGFL